MYYFFISILLVFFISITRQLLKKKNFD